MWAVGVALLTECLPSIRDSLGSSPAGHKLGVWHTPVTVALKEVSAETAKVQSQSQLYSECEANLGHVRLCLQKEGVGSLMRCPSK